MLLSVNWSIVSRALVCKYKHVCFRLVNKQALRWFYLSFDALSVLAKAACHSDRWPETPEVVVAVLQVRLQDAMTLLPSERVEFSSLWFTINIFVWTNSHKASLQSNLAAWLKTANVRNARDEVTLSLNSQFKSMIHTLWKVAYDKQTFGKCLLSLCLL